MDCWRGATPPPLPLLVAHTLSRLVYGLSHPQQNITGATKNGEQDWSHPDLSRVPAQTGQTKTGACDPLIVDVVQQ